MKTSVTRLKLSQRVSLAAAGSGCARSLQTGAWESAEDQVQLVRSGSNFADVDIIPTFSSGTLLITNRAQRGRSDLPIFGMPPNSGAPQTSTSEPSSSADQAAPILGPGPRPPPARSRPFARETAGSDLPAPLAVLNLFEHAYLGKKYGVWGRREYARDWWRTLDWSKVQKRAGQMN